jgi:hypothetical protein
MSIRLCCGSGSVINWPPVWNMEYFYANDLFCSALRKQGCIKIVIIYFFTALCIEGHCRVPSLVNYALMRFDAFRMEVIEKERASPLGPRHASF